MLVPDVTRAAQIPSWSRSGLGNLSKKNRLRDIFLAQNLDMFLDRDFQGQISDRKAKEVFKTETGL